MMEGGTMLILKIRLHDGLTVTNERGEVLRIKVHQFQGDYVRLAFDGPKEQFHILREGLTDERRHS